MRTLLRLKLPTEEVQAPRKCMEIMIQNSRLLKSVKTKSIQRSRCPERNKMKKSMDSNPYQGEKSHMTRSWIHSRRLRVPLPFIRRTYRQRLRIRRARTSQGWIIQVQGAWVINPSTWNQTRQWKHQNQQVIYWQSYRQNQRYTNPISK